MDEYRLWKKFPDVFYVNNQPVLVNGDGYYYLRMARDLLENNYKSVDDLKDHPDNTFRPNPPPLISIIVALISRFSILSQQWTAIILPSLLAPLLILPVYGLCNMFNKGRMMGLTASLFTVLSFQYVNRTRIGFLDTDCLNVIFSISITYTFMKFGLITERRRYMYFILGVFMTSLYWWHWDIVRHIVLVMGFMSLMTALIFFYRPSKKEGIIFGILFSLFIAAILFLTGKNNLLGFIDYAKEFDAVLLSDVKGVFPARLNDVREMKIPNLEGFINNTSGNIFQIFLSLIGFALLIYRNKMKALFLITPLMLAGTTIFLGHRFLIFYAPIAAMGFGYLINFFWNISHSYSVLIKTAVIIIITICSSFMFYRNTETHYSPVVMDYLPGIKKVNSLIPGEAVIWSSWGSGNPIMYYTRKKTVSDAQFPKGRDRHVYTYIPLTADNLRFSANFIQFFSEYGAAGMHTVFKACKNNPPAGMVLLKKVLSAGPFAAKKMITSELMSGNLNPVSDLKSADDYLKFLYPENSLPNYLLLQKDMTVGYEWFWFGSWDMETKTGHKPTFFPLSIKNILSNRILLNHGSINISGDKPGIFHFLHANQFRTLSLSNLKIQSGKNLINIPFHHKSDLQMELFTPSNFGAVMDSRTAESTFNKLFIRHQFKANYFRLISEDIPNYQIWLVKGDKYLK